MISRIKTYCCILSFICFSSVAQTVKFTPIVSGSQASFRGLSVASDKAAWLGGSKGTVGFSSDGGKTWKFQQLKGYEQLDFRSVYAFSDQKVVIANAGSPGVILLTVDGGLQWKEVYRNEHADAFIDGTDFWNDKEGMMYGDPIDGKMLILHTKDGGNTWKELDASLRPLLEKGEASFASSNTGLRCIGKSKAIISTGGVVSRLWISDDKGQHWQSVNTPIIQGGKMTGIFSAAFQEDGAGIIVGGDYERDTLRTDHVFYTKDFGKTWLAPTSSTRGIREGVEYLTEDIAVATGQKGIDVTYDGGVSWKPLSDDRYYDVIRKARKGKSIVIAGSRGALGIVNIESR